MNYYNRYSQDYAGKTAHLTWLEDCAYNRLLDWQYTNERELPADTQRVYGITRAITDEQRKAVDAVVTEFFPDGWNERAKVEIEKARPRIDAAVANGRKNKGKPKKAAAGLRGTTPPGMPVDMPPAMQPDKPADSPPATPVGKLPNPHTPLKEKKRDARAPANPNLMAEFPSDWTPCETSLAMVKQHALQEPKPEHVAAFVGHWLGRSIEPRRIPGEFLKWMAKQKAFDARVGGGAPNAPDTTKPFQEFRDAIRTETMPKDTRVVRIIQKWGGLRELGLKSSKDLDFRRRDFDQEYRCAQ